MEISNTEAGAIYVYDDMREEFHLRATHGMDQTMIAGLLEQRIMLDNSSVASAIRQRDDWREPEAGPAGNPVRPDRQPHQSAPGR